MSLLSVRGLTVRFGAVTAVDGVDLDLAAGERVALVGESGSGKTMLAKSLLRLTPPGAAIEGTIRFEGEEIGAMVDARLRALRGGDIGLVFQEPLTALNPALTVGRQLTEAVRLHRGLDRAAAEERAVELLRRVGFADPQAALAAHPHEFSGGMRQRILLVAALLPRPRLLVADEPTTALDALNRSDVLAQMVELTSDLGSSLLLVSHDLGLVASCATRIVVMRHGRIVEQGTTEQILRAPRDAYTRTLLESVPQRRALQHAPAASPVLQLDAVDLAYRRSGRDVTVARDVSLAVGAGETVGLVGQSGSGKSSIARAVLGLLQPAGGRILLDGVDLSTLDRRAAARRAVGMVFQDPFSSLDPRQRVATLVAEPLLRDGKPDQRRVAAMLDEVGLGGFEQRFPHQLSGGQRQRVAIARALVARPRLLVADEPCAALDVTVQAQVLALLRRLQREHGFACLFISHDLGVVEEVAHRVVVLHRGVVVEEGAAETVLSRPQHPYARRLVAAAPDLRPDGAGFVLHRRVLDPPLFEASRALDLERTPGATPRWHEIRPGHRVAVVN
jgi:peptide/nickel transport system ATP-binding protein